MRKYLVGLWLLILLVTAFTVSPAAAAPQLAGTWTITGKFVKHDGTIGNLPAMPLTLNATTDPTLFYGAFIGPEEDQNFMTIMMDSGANMHFTVSRFPDGASGGGPLYTCTTGRGTASAKKIVGSWSDDVGITGNFIMIKQP